MRYGIMTKRLPLSFLLTYGTCLYSFKSFDIIVYQNILVISLRLRQSYAGSNRVKDGRGKFEIKSTNLILVTLK